jgi:hypothetical protein
MSLASIVRVPTPLRRGITPVYETTAGASSSVLRIISFPRLASRLAAGAAEDVDVIDVDSAACADFG